MTIEGRTADLAFVGGSVIAADRRGTVAEAAAVRSSRIAAVGTRREIEALVGPGTRVVDLDGGALLPGINDSHLHAAMLGAYWPATWFDAFGSGEPLAPRELRTSADRRAALRAAWDVLLPLGITSYTEPGLGPGADGQHGDSCGAAVLATYLELARAGELPVRVNALLLFGELDGPGEPEALERGLDELGLEPGAVVGRLRIAGVKLFADGIPPMRTAWMSEPYADGAGHGSLVVPGADDAERAEHLRAMIALAQRRGHQVGVHATGSRTIDVTVAAMRDAGGADALRSYVIHGDCASDDALRAMAAHGIGLNAQPCIFDATGDLLETALGEARAARAMPLRSALDAGVPLCLSSDGPVQVPDWRRGVAAAATRRRGPDQRLAVAEAIRAYTSAGARQDHAEDVKGTIAPGALADLCVLDADPLAVAPEDIPAIGVAMTVVDGEIAFER